MLLCWQLEHAISKVLPRDQRCQMTTSFSKSKNTKNATSSTKIKNKISSQKMGCIAYLVSLQCNQKKYNSADQKYCFLPYTKYIPFFLTVKEMRVHN